MWKSPYRVAVLTASDKGAKGEREDLSGSLIQEKMQALGLRIVDAAILPDDQQRLADRLKYWCDQNTADLILTTGGTGFSPRDQMPEATLSVSEKIVPGISEAIRAYSMQITPRGMLGRGVSVIRKNTLIINLPGSPKAVSESLDVILPALEHGLDILCAQAGECAEQTEQRPF